MLHMRQVVEKHDGVPVGTQNHLKGPLRLAPSPLGSAPLCVGSNGDSLQSMNPTICRTPSAGPGQVMSPIVTFDPNNQLLRNMIARDVNLVSNSGVQKYVNESRKTTRVANLPDGTVQITFRRMVPSEQTKLVRPTHQIPILPKSIINDLNLCPLAGGKSKLPTENGIGASAFNVAPSPISPCVLSSSQPASSGPLISASSNIVHCSSTNFMKGDNSAYPHNSFLSQTVTESFASNYLSLVEPTTNPTSDAGIASDQMSWELQSTRSLSVTKGTDNSSRSICPSGAISPPFDVHLRPSSTLSSSLTDTSLEEDLKRDLNEMCPALFSPPTMDIDDSEDPTYDICPRSTPVDFGFNQSNISISRISSERQSPSHCRMDHDLTGNVYRSDSAPVKSIPSQQSCVPVGILSETGIATPRLSSENDNSVPFGRSCDVGAPFSMETVIGTKEKLSFHNSGNGLGQRPTDVDRILNPSSGISQSFVTSESLRDIVDISPEISSTVGGGKIIIIGAWSNRNSSYSCYFGDTKVPAELVQHGVLRCFCPAHVAGKVKLQVCENETPVCRPAVFEYVDSEVDNEGSKVDLHHWLAIEDGDLRRRITEKICSVLKVADPHGTLPYKFDASDIESKELEDKLCQLCEKLSHFDTPFCNTLQADHSMTLLHLAAALGYTQLIQTLCTWTDTSKTCSLAVQEADPCKRDQFGWIPLFWACSRGKFDTVCVLLQWDEATAVLKDRCGCSALSIAKDQNHTVLLRYLEKLRDRRSLKDKAKKAHSLSSLGRVLSSPGILSPNPCSLGDSSLIEDVQWDSNSLFSDASVTGSTSSSRTLAKTLAQVQAIIKDTKGDRDGSCPSSPSEYATSDDESLFDVPPFTPSRQWNTSDDSRMQIASTPLSSVSSLSPGSPNQGVTSHSPFNPASRDTAEFCEFFYNSKDILEKDFAELTLTDQEQQELYRAASVIQKAYKAYRERRKRRDHELQAATLIQSYYRRYKQYASFKKMQKGALLIQSQFRAHREERKKSRAAAVIQTYYRRYRERKGTQGKVQERNRAQQEAERKASRFLLQNSSRMRDMPADFGAKPF